MAALVLSLVVIAACGSDDKAGTPTVPPTASLTSGVATTTTTSAVTATTNGVATTSTGPVVTSIGGSVPTSVDPSTVTTADVTHNFDFRTPQTDPKDAGMLDVYTRFMTLQDQIELNPSDQGLRDQLKAITTSEFNDFLQKAYNDNRDRGLTYKIVMSAEYHPFVKTGKDFYYDGFRSVADCFFEAAAHLDSAGNVLSGETLDRESKGFEVDFVLHGSTWLASTDRDHPSICAVG